MALRAASIALSPAETRFISLLDTFASHQAPPVTCRIAGGWVRDKLLGLPSDDLDIALTISSGYGFAVGFVDYLKSCDIPTTTVGKVAANPQQSKHLETGTTRIMGFDRIPSDVQLGTPLEDATRRDLTINSLFYNVHSRQVEDYTGQGILDLTKKIARTPLAPAQTFHDDPLRVLRCVRFASRFDLEIAENVAEAIRDPSIQAALRTKVSKERVGIEITKMLQKRPLHSIMLIDSLKLHSSIFTCDGAEPSREDALRVAEILEHVLLSFSVPEPEHVLWFGAALAPFRDLFCKGKKQTPAVSVVLAQGLKLSTELNKSVTDLFTAAKMITPDLRDRSTLGLVLQHPAVKPWQRSIIWAAVMAILPQYISSGWTSESRAILQDYLDLRQHILDIGLDIDIEKPVLLNGTELQGLLEIRPGPLLNIIGQAVKAWQLDNPAANKEECEIWLTRQWAGPSRAEWEAKCPQPDKSKAEKRKR